MDGGIVRTRETLPPEEPFVAGVAEVRIPAPLGIGTMGFAPFGVDRSPTPFSNIFPGTVRAHGVLTFRAVALSRGDAHQVVLVRMDTIGVFQQLREAVLEEMNARGHELDDALILAGNHTHSGPGRIPRSSPSSTTSSSMRWPTSSKPRSTIAPRPRSAMSSRRRPKGTTIAAARTIRSRSRRRSPTCR
jgi:hypothetical protein